MMNQNRQLQNHYKFFGYMDRGVVPALSVDNDFHENMYQLGVKDGRLILFGGNPLPTFRSVDICEMVTEFGPLDEAVAHYSAVALRENGLPLPVAGVERRYKETLIYDYCLKSSLCYVEIHHKNGISSFFATKNFSIIEAMSNQLADGEKRKRPERFQNQLTTKHSELQTGLLDVIKVTPERGGFKLSKGQVNSANRLTVIMPMYSIGNYMDKLISYLGQHQVRITYRKKGKEAQLLTSLRTDILARWLNTHDGERVKKVQDSWQNAFDYGELIFPDLSRWNAYVPIRLLDITSIQALD